jgi:hypothetical protein
MTNSEFGTLMLLAVAALSLGLPETIQRRRVLAGGLLIALALASMEVSGASQDGNQAGSVTAFAITIGILSFGLCLVLSQLVVAMRSESWHGPARVPTMMVGAPVLVLGARLIAPLMKTDGWLTALATAVVLGVGLLLAGLFLGSPKIAQLVQLIIRKIGRVFPRRPEEVRKVPWDSRASALLGVHALLALGTLVVADLHLLLAGMAISLIAGVLLERRIGRLSRWPISVILVLPAMGIAWYLLAHVAGEESVLLARIGDAPYSPAFELLASAIVGLVACGLLSLWPFHSVDRGPFTPLLGAVLLVRLVAAALPEGLAHWQPVLYLLAALAACHAAVTRHRVGALSALGVVGLISGNAAAGWAGIGLVGGTVMIELYRLALEEGRAPSLSWRLLLRVLPLAGAPLVVPLLIGALGAQVFYSVITVAGAVTALSRPGR